jgi:hypothetical protein
MNVLIPADPLRHYGFKDVSKAAPIALNWPEFQSGTEEFAVVGGLVGPLSLH